MDSSRQLKVRPKFATEQDIRLAYEVEKRPILWDATLEVYKRADLKPPVWAEVAQSIGPHFTGEDAYARFKNLKDTFSRNWRKVQESWNKCSGSGTDDMYKPKWNLYNNLLFLKKACVQSGSSSNIDESSTGDVTANQCSENSILQKELLSTVQIYFDENNQEFMPIPPDDSGSSINDSVLSHTPSSPASPDLFVPPRPSSAPSLSAATAGVKRQAEEDPNIFTKKGNSKKTGASLMEEAVKVMKEISKQQPPSLDPSATRVDREEIFGSFIANRLRSMTDDAKKKCENAIMAVLLEY